MTERICDMHVHTRNSCDSPVSMEVYCLRAIEKGVDILCFTDHLDLNPVDECYGHYVAEKQFREFEEVKEKYGNRLTLMCGIEFGDPHIYRDILAEHSKLDYDFILGPVHFWYENLYPNRMMEIGITTEVCYEYYWNEVRLVIEAGGFDCLGHMDFPKRYYLELKFDPDKIAAIFKEMIRKNISLEINTSSLRYGLTETLPDKDLLAVYKDCGGSFITIGSDAHKPEHLASGREYARGLIDYFGLTEVYYRGRVPHLV